jgi:hypothetical protein
MKTVESYTKNELGKLITNLGVSKVNTWAKKELNYIRYALNQPVLIPINSNQWVIGDYVITSLSTHRYKVVKDNKLIHTFYSKPAAVLYTVLTKMQYYKTADGLLAADIDVARISDELEFYTEKLTNKNKKDPFKSQLWYARYYDFKLRFRPAREELEKRIATAKYIKIWETLI